MDPSLRPYEWFLKPYNMHIIYIYTYICKTSYITYKTAIKMGHMLVFFPPKSDFELGDHHEIRSETFSGHFS